MGKKSDKNKAPKQRDIERLEKYEVDDSSRSIADDMLTDAVADLLRSGPYPPIQFRPLPPLNMMRLLGGFNHAEPEPATDCVKDAWEDREAYPSFYHHNAYTSITMGDSTAGMLVSVVKDGQCPDGKPINLCAIHNLTGTVRATFVYFDIESAKQLVNQIGQAISEAEARAQAKA